MKIAIPVVDDNSYMDIRQWKQFMLFEVMARSIKHREVLISPFSDPWMLSQWLRDHGVDVLPAWNLDENPARVFENAGIKIKAAASHLRPEELVARYLSDLGKSSRTSGCIFEK